MVIKHVPSFCHATHSPASCSQVLSWTVTGNQRNAPPEALQQLFAELLGTIEKRCIPLVEIAMRISVDFRFIKSIWKCFMDVAIKRMQNIFSPGIPSKFHTHYTVTPICS